nr:hypothetical protein CFP56_01620 [Quercus suber]
MLRVIKDKPIMVGISKCIKVSSAGNFGNFSPNLGSFGNFASQPLSGFPNQAEMMNCSPQMIGYSPQHSGTQPQSQFNVPQCPITQSQCEQLLSFLASQSLKEASNHQVAPTHQAASVLSPLANVAANSSASLPPHFINNFSVAMAMNFQPQHQGFPRGRGGRNNNQRGIGGRGYNPNGGHNSSGYGNSGYNPNSGGYGNSGYNPNSGGYGNSGYNPHSGPHETNSYRSAVNLGFFTTVFEIYLGSMMEIVLK